MGRPHEFSKNTSFLLCEHGMQTIPVTTEIEEKRGSKEQTNYKIQFRFSMKIVLYNVFSSHHVFVFEIWEIHFMTYHIARVYVY